MNQHTQILGNPFRLWFSWSQFVLWKPTFHQNSIFHHHAEKIDHYIIITSKLTEVSSTFKSSYTNTLNTVYVKFVKQPSDDAYSSSVRLLGWCSRPARHTAMSWGYRYCQHHMRSGQVDRFDSLKQHQGNTCEQIRQSAHFKSCIFLSL